MSKNLAAPGILMLLALTRQRRRRHPPGASRTGQPVKSTAGPPARHGGWHPDSPFKARAALLDNEVPQMLAGGQAFTGAQILNMNFLVQGVQGKLNN